MKTIKGEKSAECIFPSEDMSIFPSEDMSIFPSEDMSIFAVPVVTRRGRESKPLALQN